MFLRTKIVGTANYCLTLKNAKKMKVKCRNQVLLFEADENEKIFLVYATSYGHGDSFARFMTSKEILEEGWFDQEDWEHDFRDLKIGERTTYLGLGGGHNFITRVN